MEREKHSERDRVTTSVVGRIGIRMSYVYVCMHESISIHLFMISYDGNSIELLTSEASASHRASNWTALTAPAAHAACRTLRLIPERHEYTTVPPDTLPAWLLELLLLLLLLQLLLPPSPTVSARVACLLAIPRNSSRRQPASFSRAQ